MKVLIIGNADSIWVKSLIDKTHLAYGDNVSVLSPKNGLFADYYANRSVVVYDIKRIKSKFFLINIVKNMTYLTKHYDLISVQYPEHWNAFWGLIGSLFNKRLILSFWGSDLLRNSSPDRIVLRAIKCSAAVSLTTLEMQRKFIELYGEQYKEKIRMTRFGSNGLAYLDSVFITDDTYCKYGIPKDKVIVSIGYNKMKEQQHLEVLSIIDSLSHDIKERIHIILRLTYGNGDSEYIDCIKTLLRKSCCSYSIFEEYLSDFEVAELTKLTDIFIHAQTTDARSASLSEHLYAKCLVLNPSWLKYPDYENGVFYLEFSGFDDLKGILLSNIEKKENSIYRSALSANTKMISDICSWESIAPIWRRIYEE